ncbi:MAG: hypothetical protein HY901_20245 [Deltaproteobacteria bacterium]|nr:hypothetical protein [Deltaproteobacteria bacterium]
MMRRLLVPLAALALTAACAKGATTAGPAKLRAVDYHPLAIGNQWTYAGRMLGQPVEKTITIQGMKEGFFADDANGLLKVDVEGLRDEKRYLLREPIMVGKTWSAVVSVASTERFEIADVGFTANTPAGSFHDCVLVRATNRADAERSLRSEWTFAPNVGIVRISITAVVNGREIPQGSLLELTSYKLAVPKP